MEKTPFIIHKIEVEETSNTNTPKLTVFRKSLFWDTDISLIDWNRQYKAVINRVFERGNEDERNETIRFYGTEKVNSALKSATTKPMKLYKNS